MTIIIEIQMEQHISHDLNRWSTVKEVWLQCSVKKNAPNSNLWTAFIHVIDEKKRKKNLLIFWRETMIWQYDEFIHLIWCLTYWLPAYFSTQFEEEIFWLSIAFRIWACLRLVIQKISRKKIVFFVFSLFAYAFYFPSLHWSRMTCEFWYFLQIILSFANGMRFNVIL